MPSHRRTRSCASARASPPQSPPHSPRSPKAVRLNIMRTPAPPSVRRRYGLQTPAEAKYANQLQVLAASLPVRRNSPPTTLLSPFVLRTSPTGSRGVIHEEDEDDGAFIIHHPRKLSSVCESTYPSRYVDPDAHWSEDPFDMASSLFRSKRPVHRHKRSSSVSFTSTTRQSRLQTPLPTIPSATPSPAISAAPSPAARPLALAPEVDFDLLVPQSSIPFGWPGAPSSGSPGLLPTPAFSTPGLSPSASSTAGSPCAGANADYFMLRTPNTPRTPVTPRPVPE